MMSWASGEHDESTYRWPRRLLLGAAGLTLFLVSLALVLWWTWQSTVSRQLAEIRARGEPTTFAELDSYYVRPPADQDATNLLLRAGAVLQAAEGTEALRTLPFFGEADDPPRPGQSWAELDLAKTFLADHAEALSQLHDAAELGGRAYFSGVSGENTLALGHLQALRADARALRLEAIVLAHSGDTRGAAAALRAGLVLSNALEFEPLLVSQLVRIGMFGNITHEIKHLLPVVDFADDELAQLQEQLQAVDFVGGIKRAMIGDRVGGIATFENPASAGITGWQAALWRPLHGAAEGLFLRIMDDYVRAAEQPWPQMLATAAALRSETTNLQSPMHEITQLVLPPLDMTVQAFARSETTRRLMIVAIGLERFRRREGSAPSELAALVPTFLDEVPDDPTSGGPLHYARTEVGYVVYNAATGFPVPYDEELDAETGANPMLLFRWPPLPEKLRIKKLAAPTRDGEAGANDASADELPVEQPGPVE